MTDTQPDKAKKPPIEKVHSEDKVDEAVEQSFPASDPPAYSTPHHNEPPAGGEKKKG